jgi:hypothetical protein
MTLAGTEHRLPIIAARSTVEIVTMKWGLPVQSSQKGTVNHLVRFFQLWDTWSFRPCQGNCARYGSPNRLGPNKTSSRHVVKYRSYRLTRPCVPLRKLAPFATDVHCFLCFACCLHLPILSLCTSSCTATVEISVFRDTSPHSPDKVN